MDDPQYPLIRPDRYEETHFFLIRHGWKDCSGPLNPYAWYHPFIEDGRTPWHTREAVSATRTLMRYPSAYGPKTINGKVVKAWLNAEGPR